MHPASLAYAWKTLENDDKLIIKDECALKSSRVAEGAVDKVPEEFAVEYAPIAGPNSI
jgi:hypothetical protein